MQPPLPIKLAYVKDELARIDAMLGDPLVLIGGLAVQQYDLTRDSFDIDLVCDHDTARSILKALYPSEDWDYEDRNQDEYRPEFVIRHKVRTEYPALRFGPKIAERRPYNYIPWDELPVGAQQFEYKGTKLSKILVPTVEKLCLMKFASYFGRSPAAADKIRQDLSDIVTLSNHVKFRLGEFYNLARRWGIETEIRNRFATLPEAHDSEFERSYLRKLARLFSPSVQLASGATAATPAVLQPVHPANIGDPEAPSQETVRLAEKLSSAGITRFNLTRADYPSTLAQFLDQANSSITIVSMLLRSKGDENDIVPLFARKLKKHPQFRVIVSLVRPDSPACHAAAAILGMEYASLSSEITAMLDALVRLREGLLPDPANRLFVLRHKIVPSASAIILDDGTPSACLQTEVKLYEASRSDSYGFALHPGTEFYRRHTAAYHRVLRNADPYPDGSHPPVLSTGDED